MIWKNLSFVFALGLMGSCVSVVENDPYGRAIPKDPRWSVQPNSGSNENIPISFESLYLRQYESILGYEGYRFFPNGQCIGKYVENREIDPVEAFSSLHGARIGYYETEGERITIQFFVPRDYGNYTTIEGYFDQSGNLVIDVVNPERLFSDGKIPEETYFKVDASELKEISPDW